MFNKEIRFISDLSLNNIKNLGTFFTVEKLLSANLHPAITTYISAEIEYLIYQDRQKLLKDSVFDYSGKEISKYFNLITNEIKNSKRISFEDVKRLIIQAVSFNANFTVRPRWSLAKLIFEDGSTKSGEEINLILNYVHYASYLKKIIIEYLTRRKLTNLSITEFELIINKIDRELFNSQPEKLVENSLYSMADFFNIGALSKTKVNVGYFELFLKEKNLIEYLLRLNRATAKDSRTNLEISELKKIIFSTEPIPSEPVAEIGIDEIEKIELTDLETVDEKLEDKFNEEQQVVTELDEIVLDEIHVQDEPKTEPNKFDEISTEEDEVDSDSEKLNNLLKDVPAEREEEDRQLLSPNKEKELLEFFNDEFETTEETFSQDEIINNTEDQFSFEIEDQTDKNIVEDQSNESIAKVENDDNKIKEPEQENSSDIISPPDEQIISELKVETKNIIAEEITSTQNEIVQPPKPPEKDLSSYLTDKETSRIVSDIFNEDRDDFVITIEKITECRNYDEATEILKSIFLTSRINPFSREAVTFTNAVSNYFNNL